MKGIKNWKQNLKSGFVKGIALPLTFLIALATAHINKAEAGVGARAMGMGGAHVSVANDATCTYWNPAGLADTKEQATVCIDPSLNYNYAGFASYAKPLKHNDGFAVSLTGRGESYKGKHAGDEQLWFSTAYGKNLNKNLALGTAIHLKTRRLEGKLQKFQVEQGTDDFTSVDADFGALCNVGKFRLGLLVEHLVKANEKGCNVRPGISYSNGKTTIAADYYDILGRYEKYDREDKPDKGLCIGMEQELNDRFAVRVGCYKTTTTAGFGWKSKKGNWRVDYGYIKKWNGHLFSITKEL